MMLCILGSGICLPQTCVSNDELCQTLDSSNEWIQERTGISQRYIAKGDETTATLGAKAALEALKSSSIKPPAVDLIIVATSTPDDIFPPTAIKIQSLIQAYSAVAFDLPVACSGFIFALETAYHFLMNGSYQTALVIGSETMSKILDWTDRSTCVLFGDGAGAFVIKKNASYGHKLLKTKIFSNGSRYDDLVAKRCFSNTGYGSIAMNGREVFKNAVQKMAQAIEALGEEKIDWVVPHQANYRIFQSLAQMLNFPIERIVSTIAMYANTSAASIPLAYHSKQFARGEKIALVCMGAGFSWGSALIET